MMTILEPEESVAKSQDQHIPVMLNEVMDFLQPQAAHVCVDGTLGLGGHAQAIVKCLGSKGRFIGIDRDAHALSSAREKFLPHLDQCDFIHGDFRHIDQILRDIEIRGVDRILLDLGISSFQLDNPQRGFSLRSDGPLDMRMDQESHITAFDLVNSLSENEIATILKDFGQERWSLRIARNIVLTRQDKPIETTRDLRRIVLRSLPYRRSRQKIHPATRTFQAFRIAVNRELEALEEALNKCIQLLNPGGRIVVIAFHSLEDRIVKEIFRHYAKKEMVRLIVKKPLRPSEQEARSNPRSRSARLRIAERL